MCSTCTTYQTKKQLTVHGRQNRYDPTRTITLRQAFISDLRKRFRKIRGLIRAAVVDRDVFGLQGQAYESHPQLLAHALPGVRAFAFDRSGEKVQAFMRWLDQQVAQEMLTVSAMPQLGAGVEGAWTNMYVQDSYKRGVMRANHELRNAGFNVPGIQQQGGIDAMMSTPFHMDRVGVIYTRVYEELRGITAAMDQQISRVLAQGMIDGDGPALLARKMNATISGMGIGTLGLTDTLGRFIPAERRATIMARTEVIRAHHLGAVQEYRNWRVEGVRVRAEFRSADDERVCWECEDLERGGPYTLEEVEGMIPVHPQCRCVAIPTQPELDPDARRAEPMTSPPDEVTGEMQLTPDIIDELHAAPDEAFWRAGVSSEDAYMRILNKHRGFDRLPTVVSQSQMDNLIAQGHTEMWRGVSNARFATEFRQGQFFAGKGVYGNGTYAATGNIAGDGARGIAAEFAGGAGNRGIMRMTLQRNVRTIEHLDAIPLQEKYRALAERMRRYAADPSLPSPIKGVQGRAAAERAATVLDNIAINPGRTALMEGYDAIIVPYDAVYGRHAAREIAILNRGKVLVQGETQIVEF